MVKLHGHQIHTFEIMFQVCEWLLNSDAIVMTLILCVIDKLVVLWLNSLMSVLKADSLRVPENVLGLF